MRLKKLVYLGCLLFGGWSLPLASHATLAAKISLDVTNIKISELLKIIAKEANKSIVISEKIEGKITMQLQDVSWCAALDAVVQMQNLIKHEQGNVITIVTAEELNKSEAALLQPTVFNLHYASADNIAKMLKPAGVLSPYGKAGAEIGSNALVVADTNDHLARVAQLLQKLDVPAKQVLIEARIVSADAAFMQELGLEFGTTIAAPAAAKELKLPPGQFNMAIAKFKNNALLDLRLAALENAGRGKVISRPKLLAADRQAASIEAGAEIPYQEKTKEGNTSISFKKAVLSLTVTPEVVAKDTINLSLQLNQDKVGQLVVNGVPTIDTRKIHTQVLVHNNETIVLGGIYEWSKVQHLTRVPILGSLPLLKILFSKKETRLERKELLIFVTLQLVS